MAKSSSKAARERQPDRPGPGLKQPASRSARPADAQPSTTHPGNPIPTGGPWTALASLGLLVLVFLAYYPVTGFDFVNYDDPKYVYENPMVSAGLTVAGIKWAFTTFHASNWHPLTWLSHMVDCQWFGLNPGRHHLVNLLLHLANTALLLGLLRRLTGRWIVGLLVAALWALHPLHVESVAWVAERKDVLSTFFWLLTIRAYVHYVHRPGPRRYMLVFLGMALGLMAKPMLVTLPLVLLLLDYWPLGRWPGLAASSSGAWIPWRTATWGLVREKLPLLALSATSSVITYLAQQHGGAVTSWERLPLVVRAANAAISYAQYLFLSFWPHDLAALYPHPKTASWGWAGAALILLLGLTALIIHQARQRPFLPVGWLWFLGTLVPVIGLVQVGGQAMADRYTYVPQMGLLVILAGGLRELLDRNPRAATWLLAPALTAVLALALATRVQVGYWSSGLNLFTRAAAVTENNDLAHYNVGNAMQRAKDYPEAVKYYLEALRINPKSVETYINLGLVRLNQGNFAEAAGNFQTALELDPRSMGALSNLGLTSMRQGRLEEAVEFFRRALAVEPNEVGVHNNLGTALWALGRREEGFSEFTMALRLKPDEAEGWNNLGKAAWALGRLDEAVRHFAEALRLNPNHAQARTNLNNLRRQMGTP